MAESLHERLVFRLTGREQGEFFEARHRTHYLDTERYLAASEWTALEEKVLTTSTHVAWIIPPHYMIAGEGNVFFYALGPQWRDGITPDVEDKRLCTDAVRLLRECPPYVAREGQERLRLAILELFPEWPAEMRQAVELMLRAFLRWYEAEMQRQHFTTWVKLAARGYLHLDEVVSLELAGMSDQDVAAGLDMALRLIREEDARRDFFVLVLKHRGALPRKESDKKVTPPMHWPRVEHRLYCNQYAVGMYRRLIAGGDVPLHDSAAILHSALYTATERYAAEVRAYFERIGCPRPEAVSVGFRHRATLLKPLREATHVFPSTLYDDMCDRAPAFALKNLHPRDRVRLTPAFWKPYLFCRVQNCDAPVYAGEYRKVYRALVIRDEEDQLEPGQQRLFARQTEEVKRKMGGHMNRWVGKKVKISEYRDIMNESSE